MVFCFDKETSRLLIAQLPSEHACPVKQITEPDL